MRLFLCVLLLSSLSHASDGHFEFLKPIDEPITNKLSWTSQKLADDMSDYLLYTMYAAPVVLISVDASLGGDKIGNRFGALLTAHLTTGILSQTTKHLSNRTRPNGGDQRSFFSGHTSAAFTTAGYLCAMEPDKCRMALLGAGAVGYLRVAAKKHWFSDVFVGALVGYAVGYQMPILVWGF